MKKSLPFAAVMFLLMACGDTVENINQIGMLVADSEDDLPECTDDREGEQAVVKGESVVRVCIDGDWEAMDGADAEGFSCKTEELKDKSGLKIVCNGDSIGVVLNGEKGKDGSNGKDGEDGKNGSDGEDGKAGSGCAMTEKTDSTVTVVCGDSTIVIELGVGANGDTLELDSEKVSISLDSLAGYTQKGPFLKGSTVYLYELSDGRTLKQTNGNFTSFITRDDGRYKFTARDLASQYAMIVVEGNYRNEVTGEPSNAPIRLRALTDMRKRSSANVNLLTHLEFDRVNYLVTREHKTVKAAKKQAQAEIFNAFHIDTTGFTGAAEDLDVFGATDADAALLAISVLLQGDSNETALSVLLTEISDAIAESGKWDDSLTKARLADWALKADFAGAASRLDTFRIKVGNWHLSDTVPEYEKHVRKFFGIESRMGVCGSDSVPVGFVKHVKNPHASTYYASGYSDVSNTQVRFICKEDGGVFKWRIATDIEKDTMSLGHEFAEGLVKKGLVNANLSYVYENGNWRHGTPNDGIVNVGCIQARKDTVAKSATGNTWYKCIGDSTMNLEESSWTSAWRLANNIEKDTATWGHDYSEGDEKKGNVNTSLAYVYENGNWRHGKASDGYIGKGCVPARKDTVAKGSNGTWYKCVTDTSDSYSYNGQVESAWTSTWRLASNIEKDTATWGHDYSEGDVKKGNVNTSLAYVYEKGNWRHGKDSDGYIGKGCVAARKDTVAKGSDGTWYKCVTGTSDSYTYNGLVESVWSTSWRTATNIEKDTATWGHSYSEGAVRNGKVNTTLTYVYQNNNWRLGTSIDSLIRKGCVTGRQDTVAQASNASWYICKSNSWRLATDIEKDTATWGHSYSEGTVRNGKVNATLTYVYQNNNWRLGTSIDSLIRKGCVTGRQDTVAQASNAGWYICKSNSWRLATDIEKDTATWGHNYTTGTVKNGKVNKNLTYVYQNNNWRHGTSLDSILVKAGGKACITNNDTSTVKYNSVYYVCTAQSTSDTLRKWVVAPAFYNDTYEARSQCKTGGTYATGNLMSGRVYSNNKYLCDAGVFRNAYLSEINGGKGCTSYNRNALYALSKDEDGNTLHSYYKCTANGWVFTLDKLITGSFTDSRNSRKYKTVGINNLTWMTESLDLDYKVKTKSGDSTYGTYCYKNNCSSDTSKMYGRYYTWAAVMDSAAVYSSDGAGCGYKKTNCGAQNPVRGICPSGWRLPNENDWRALATAMGGTSTAGKLLKSKTGWDSYTDIVGGVIDGNGLDSATFSAYPAGYRYTNGTFNYVKTEGEFWFLGYSSSGELLAYVWGFNNKADNVSSHSTYEYIGFPVRCVKNVE